MLPLIKIGDRGEWVAYCQNLLNARLVVSGALWVDAQFGASTDVAIRNFQMTKGLKMDGKVGDDTWTALEAGPPPINKRPRIPIVYETQGGGI